MDPTQTWHQLTRPAGTPLPIDACRRSGTLNAALRSRDLRYTCGATDEVLGQHSWCSERCARHRWKAHIAQGALCMHNRHCGSRSVCDAPERSATAHGVDRHAARTANHVDRVVSRWTDDSDLTNGVGL